MVVVHKGAMGLNFSMAPLTKGPGSVKGSIFPSPNASISAVLSSSTCKLCSSSATMSHTHEPGQPSHSHGPQPQQGGVAQPTMAIRPPDPVMQAIIEDSFTPVDLALGPPDNVAVQCGPHKLEKCTDCDVDYSTLNRISKTLLLNPNLRCPPPPQIITQKISQAVTVTKEEGNVGQAPLICFDTFHSFTAY